MSEQAKGHDTIVALSFLTKGTCGHDHSAVRDALLDHRVGPKPRQERAMRPKELPAERDALLFVRDEGAVLEEICCDRQCRR
jgi:hypothetical protein